MIKRNIKRKMVLENFERVKMRASVLDNMINDSIIIELKDGSIYAAQIDDYVGYAIAVYHCYQPADDGSGWVEQTDREQIWEGKPQIDHMPYFYFSEMKNIYKPKNDKLFLEDVKKLWIDPLYRPLPYIECNWDHDNPEHSPECNKDLHEALTKIYTNGHHWYYDKPDDGMERKYKREFDKSFGIIREFIIEHGGRIP